MEPIELINLTPHEIVLYSGPEVVARIPSTGVCRVNSIAGLAEDVGGLPVPVAAPYRYGSVDGLPTLKEMRAAPNRRYVVSFMVASAVAAENEGMRGGDGRAAFLLSPDTDKHAVRVEGRIVGTTRLVRAV